MDLRKLERKRIGEILVEEGLLKPEDLKRALELQKKQGGLIGSILVSEGYVSEENLAMGLSKQLGIPYLRLSSYNVNRRAQRLIPQEVAERYLLFPFEEGEGVISIAMSDPLNEEAQEAIKKRVPSRLQVFLATVSDIRETIKTFYSTEGAQAVEAEGR